MIWDMKIERKIERQGNMENRKIQSVEKIEERER